MHLRFRPLVAASALAVAVTLMISAAHADPLAGRDRAKFVQLPMINTTILDPTGAPGIYGGHDELSTAYGFPNTANVIPLYQGKFMADDFADNLSSPIVHVKWWGSYFNDIINQAMPVNKFLISFESDVPASPGNPFSFPGQPLLNQVVFRGPLAPGSGTFTEKVIRGPDPLLNESLYEYNAELHLGKNFPELKDTVYWLKIVALVDAPAGATFDPYQPPTAVTRWGWHNRDYTIQNTLASPNVAPGEAVVGVVGGNTPVWHFQDDAIAGDVRINTQGAGGLVMPDVFQPFQNFVPQNYKDLTDGPASNNAAIPPISNFSKDLAFAIYTTVPEPASATLTLLALAAATGWRRRGGAPA